MQELVYVCPLNHFTPFGNLLLGGKKTLLSRNVCIIVQNTVLYLAKFVGHSFENTPVL